MPKRFRADKMAVRSRESKACLQSKKINSSGLFVNEDHSMALRRMNGRCFVPLCCGNLNCLFLMCSSAQSTNLVCSIEAHVLKTELNRDIWLSWAGSVSVPLPLKMDAILA